MKHVKRLCSVLLVLCLVLALLPATVFAEETELKQLATPTGLTWGEDDREGMRPGAIQWTVDGDCQNQFRVLIYKVGETEPVMRGTWDFGTAEKTVFSVDDFIRKDPDSGTYYFTIQALGDGTSYTNSEIATSETWTYTKPDAQLDVVPSVAWDWPAATWELLSASNSVYCYEVEFFFSAEEGGEPQSIGAHWGGGATHAETVISDSYVAENGVGYYYFRVRALSEDITAYQNGPWTELSPAYNATETTVNVKDALSDILADENADVREAVQKLDRDDLRTAMLADSEVLDLIAQLESKTGVEVEVEVVEDFDDFPADGIEIAGASLNDVSGNTTVTLQVGKPDNTDFVIPELYDDTVAVRFSMDLDGVEDTDELAVPVRITLPVPETINPQFLAILHYDQDGIPEVLKAPDRLYIYYDEGWYVSFVLDHFSDFVMTEEIMPDVRLWIEPAEPVAGDTVTCTVETEADLGKLSYAWYRGTIEEDGSRTFDRIEGVDSNTYVATEADVGYYLSCEVTAENYSNLALSVITYGPVQPSEADVPDENPDIDSWLPIIGAVSVPSGSSKPTEAMNFTDVSTGDWFYSDVKYVYDNGLMNGTGSGKFSPNGTLTRAMIVTILYRMEGEPSGRYIGRFADVPNYQWYTDAVEWAAKCDIVTGYTATKFGPNDPVTREQLAAILYRYAQYKGRSVVPSDSLGGCADSASVSSYAVSAVEWAVAGDMLLVENAKLRPTESATRAEVAVAIANFCRTYLD